MMNVFSSSGGFGAMRLSPFHSRLLAELLQKMHNKESSERVEGAMFAGAIVASDLQLMQPIMKYVTDALDELKADANPKVRESAWEATDRIINSLIG